MFEQIKGKIDANLARFIDDIDRLYGLSSISPLLFKSLKDFVLRDGKRVRPILFVVGYLGFAKRQAPGLYTSALAVELLHDFMLVHDDIIDKSDTRRGRPSMHAMLNGYLRRFHDNKFNGQDLSIVVGDVMYAAAINAFLAIQEDFSRKEKALKNFIEAAVYTGCGEFIELISGLKNIGQITKRDINTIYDYKTARYTFATPLSTGAILAGAPPKEIKKLIRFGIAVGRGFQINDDILGIFGNEKEIGKSTLTDLQESKKTLLIWYAYRHAKHTDQIRIKKILTKHTVTQADLLLMRTIINDSRALRYARAEIARLVREATRALASCAMQPRYKNGLLAYARHVLTA